VSRIHATAIVDEAAILGEDVVIGPFAIVESDVTLGARTIVDAHAIVRSGTALGEDNHVHPFAVLGDAPQDRRHAGEATRLVVGRGNVFREHVTAHRGTAHGGGVTRIGDGCLFMAGVHIAHDCWIGDGATLANATLLGGHVELEAHVTTGGQVAIAPFVKIGERAFLAGGAMVEQSVPPFVIAAGDRAKVRALNRVGLERAGISEASRAALERAFRAIFRGESPRVVAARNLVDDADPFVRALAAFVAREQPPTRAHR
jgi:UDP-N-acetylglucosamine acyltransferase